MGKYFSERKCPKYDCEDPPTKHFELKKMCFDQKPWCTHHFKEKSEVKDLEPMLNELRSWAVLRSPF